MATMHTDPVTGQETFTGFSWTTLFFGPIPALARRDWLGLVIGLALGVILAVLVGTIAPAAGSDTAAQLLSAAVWVVWAALYNDNHARRVAAAR